MNALPPTLMPGTSLLATLHPSDDALTAKWLALHDAANAVAAIAGIEPQLATTELRDFPALIRAAAPWRRDLADQGIEDMTAMIQPGIAGLFGLGVRGAETQRAALALWREFVAARAAVLALLPRAGET